jgi:hypothetical protein
MRRSFSLHPGMDISFFIAYLFFLVVGVDGSLIQKLYSPQGESASVTCRTAPSLSSKYVGGKIYGLWQSITKGEIK